MSVLQLMREIVSCLNQLNYSTKCKYFDLMQFDIPHQYFYLKNRNVYSVVLV